MKILDSQNIFVLLIGVCFGIPGGINLYGLFFKTKIYLQKQKNSYIHRQEKYSFMSKIFFPSLYKLPYPLWYAINLLKWLLIFGVGIALIIVALTVKFL